MRKKFEIEEEAKESKPFTFIQKEGPEEDQKCFVKDFIDKEFMAELVNPHQLMPAKQARKIKKMKKKLEQIVEMQDKYEVS